MLHWDVVFVEFTNFVCSCSELERQSRFQHLTNAFGGMGTLGIDWAFIMTISHNNENRNSVRTSSPLHASVKSSCAQPSLPPRDDHQVLALFFLGWQIRRGWDTWAAKCPTVGTKKEGECPVRNPHCSRFHWSHSATSIFSVKFFVLVNVCNNAIFIKLCQNHSWFLFYHCYLRCY